MNHDFSRRDFLRIVGAACAVPGFAAYKKVPIALELYSIREDCKNDFPGSLVKVAQMGYDGVEFAGYHGLEAKQLRKILDDNGLRCFSVHTGLNTLTGDNFEPTVEFNKILGNRSLIVPGMPRMEGIQAWYDAAQRFNEIAAKLEAHGMRVGYHNHTREFVAADGKIPWEVFFDNTNKSVIHQLDVGHVLRAKADPAHYIKKYPGRTLSIHAKDYSPDKEAVLIGEGVVKWPEIFALCESVGGIECYIIEQESYPYPPMESVRRCLENFKRLRGEA